MDITLDALFAVVAETKGKSYPCMLDPLQNLIRTVCGEAPGPSAPYFYRDCIVAGLVVLQQHPALDNIQLPGDLDNHEQHAAWMRREKARLKLKDTYDIQTPATIVVTAAYDQANKIAAQTIRNSRS